MKKNIETLAQELIQQGKSGNQLILDTEFIDLNKPFVYNLGYRIINQEGVVLQERDFVIKQVYENKPLFATSYYANKRPLYVSRLKGRKMQRVTLSVALWTMRSDIATYNVQHCWAYNAPADRKSLGFTAKWFKNKPFEYPINDIMVLSRYKLLSNPSYQDFCIEHNLLTGKGNLKISAESCFAYISKNPNYEEEHTALADSRIEADILRYCVNG